ncbi:Transmembrane protein [Phytophthora megakarya]|uniref:Transmembrane protein n=1 Tax=Phytophthora megakarya TaxID=4795 RepID=A0A225WFY3_9STRA|nr:Transmembrane protein [Phytophthora megakarya]
MPSERSSKSFSFISEGSFCAESAAYDWDRIAAQSGAGDDVYGLRVPRELRVHSSTPTDLDDVLNATPRSRTATAASNSCEPQKQQKQQSVAFDRTWVDSEIPVVGRSSSAPPSIQLLQEVLHPSERRRAATAPPSGFFNHLLYGSLQPGALAELFSEPYCGLAISAAATGFMIPFLADAFQPLLCVYLSFNDDQCTATLRFIKLPGVISFFIGLVSDFYPLWSFHRKSYMLGGWIFAYLALMALVIVALIDDSTGLMNPSVRTFYGGAVYVLLMMAASLGITVASVTAFAFLVELSQHVMISLVVGYNSESDTTEAVISMKVIILIMAVVTLIPIPAVLFRLDEEPRQLKVDSVDRSSLTRQLWSILQQEAVWRIILFICFSVFLASFRFNFVDDAVMYWANATPNAERVGDIPQQIIMIVSILAFQLTLFNYTGISRAAVLLVTSLPIVEITENCLEGATTGLVSSYNTLISMVILTFSEAISKSSAQIKSDFSDDVIAQDSSETRTQVLSFVMANSAINLLALVPILYLLPRQKLEAQEMLMEVIVLDDSDNSEAASTTPATTPAAQRRTQYDDAVEAALAMAATFKTESPPTRNLKKKKKNSTLAPSLLFTKSQENPTQQLNKIPKTARLITCKHHQAVKEAQSGDNVVPVD